MVRLSIYKLLWWVTVIGGVLAGLLLHRMAYSRISDLRIGRSYVGRAIQDSCICRILC